VDSSATGRPATSRPATSKPATIYDVAKLAGVSHQTVSRVLRGAAGAGADTRERVQRALEELHYRPSVVARELASSRASRIGVVGYETFESSTSKVLRGVNDVAVDAGYVLDIVTVNPVGDVDEIARRLDAINGSDVAGLLATSPTAQVREALNRSVFRMPVFFDVTGDINTEPGPLEGTSTAAHLVMDHLVELGHRRIAHIAGPTGWDSAAKREAVYLAAIEQHGLPSIPVARGDWSAASGYRAVHELLVARDPAADGRKADAVFTAIFVANDRMALGALRALDELGVRVPEDVSVVGIDDIPEAEYFIPPLTTVHVDFEEAGRVAARSLITLIERPGTSMPTYPSSRFVLRSSTSSPRG
jgi:DNA-binding LacI/PurR family transcriptional regulator